MTALLREHEPDVVAIERVFTQNNKGTATGTAQAAGVAALAAAQADRPVAWHTPSEVKAAISGNGRADKEQVTAHGHPGAGPRRGAASRPTPPTPSRWPSATCGAGPPSSGCARPRSPAASGRPSSSARCRGGQGVAAR